MAVRMDQETQQRLMLTTRKLKRARRRPEIVAYGVLQEDPGASFSLRAPIAGYVQAAKAPWPQLGQQLKAGTPIGSVSPRLSPAERADLAQRLATAQAEVEEVQIALQTARENLERQRLMFKKDATAEKNVLEAEA